MLEKAERKAGIVEEPGSRRKAVIPRRVWDPPFNGYGNGSVDYTSSLRERAESPASNRRIARSSPHTSFELSFLSSKPVLSSAPSPVWKSSNNIAIARRNPSLPPPMDSSEHETTSIGDACSISSGEFYFKGNDPTSHLYKENTDPTRLGYHHRHIPNCRK